MWTSNYLRPTSLLLKRDRDRSRERGGKTWLTIHSGLFVFVFIFVLEGTGGGTCWLEKSLERTRFLKINPQWSPAGGDFPQIFRASLCCQGDISQCWCLILESLWVKHVQGAMAQLLNYFQKENGVLWFPSSGALVQVISYSKALFCATWMNPAKPCRLILAEIF